jgi:hypothetical protein
MRRPKIYFFISYVLPIIVSCIGGAIGSLVVIYFMKK